MKSEKYLSDLYEMYTSRKLSKTNFEGKIFKHLLDNFERFRLFRGNRDTWSDFLASLYPRIVRAIDLYRDQGSSFDAYITSLIHCAAREYRCRESDRSITEYVCWKAKAEDVMVAESEPEYNESRKNVSIPTEINPRQILFLLLKSYFFVSDEFVKKVSQTIGMDPVLVQGIIDELRRRRFDKDAEIMNLRERLHCQHYRCIAYQKRLIYTQKGTDYHDRMKERYERARKRFFKMKKRLGGIRMSASNRMIAEVLGIPRGTVDSSLSAIKHRLIPDDTEDCGK
jgi:DNA-directed RNA polymerase specialized sigma24 family protein/predicted transcriptional regulator with HTH domain